jgi:hypothetical protein
MYSLYLEGLICLVLVDEVVVLVLVLLVVLVTLGAEVTCCVDEVATDEDVDRVLVVTDEDVARVFVVTDEDVARVLVVTDEDVARVLVASVVAALGPPLAQYSASESSIF